MDSREPDTTESTPSPGDTRTARLFARAAIHDVPLGTILATVFVVVAVFFAGKLLYRLRDLLLLLVVVGFVALILNPLVVALQHWRVRRRGYAVMIVATASVVVFGLLAFAFGYPLVNGITHLADTLPGYVNNAEHGKGWIGHLIARYHVTTWVQSNAAKLVSFANGLSKPALALGKGALSMLVTLVTLFAFVILLLLEGPKIRRVALDLLSPERARRAEQIGSRIAKASLGFVIGNLILSLVAAVVVFVTLWILHVPFAMLFALWVLLVDFLPQVGGALAGIPTVAFAFVHSTPAGLVTLIVFVVYTLVQNHALYPIVMSRAIKLNPLLVFLAILVGAELGAWVGGTFGGLVGVILAIPLAAALHVIVTDWWESSAPRRTKDVSATPD